MATDNGLTAIKWLQADKVLLDQDQQEYDVIHMIVEGGDEVFEEDEDFDWDAVIVLVTRRRGDIQQCLVVDLRCFDPVPDNLN